jgi:hypothetical protein
MSGAVAIAVTLALLSPVSDADAKGRKAKLVIRDIGFSSPDTGPPGSLHALIEPDGSVSFTFSFTLKNVGKRTSPPSQVEIVESEFRFTQFAPVGKIRPGRSREVVMVAFDQVPEDTGMQVWHFQICWGIGPGLKTKCNPYPIHVALIPRVWEVLEFTVEYDHGDGNGPNENVVASLPLVFEYSRLYDEFSTPTFLWLARGEYTDTISGTGPSASGSTCSYSGTGTASHTELWGEPYGANPAHEGWLQITTDLDRYGANVSENQATFDEQIYCGGGSDLGGPVSFAGLDTSSGETDLEGWEPAHGFTQHLVGSYTSPPTGFGTISYNWDFEALI